MALDFEIRHLYPKSTFFFITFPRNDGNWDEYDMKARRLRAWLAEQDQTKFDLKIFGEYSETRTCIELNYGRNKAEAILFKMTWM